MPTLYCKNENGYTEQIRFMFAETGIKFDEENVTEKDMESKLIFKQLPMLEWDGYNLCESAAIMEHIAVMADSMGVGRGNTYLGANEEERSLARSFTAAANEFRRQLYEQYVRSGPAQDQDTFKSSTLPAWLTRLNKLAVQSHNDDLSLGPGVSFTFGDVAMYEMLEQISFHFGADVFEDYRELRDYYRRCASRPRFRMYIDNRPERDAC
eukprot:m.33265 g.33265  ORF g.33265 m.33265 type:complete len:210 (+) comp9851_c0_seq1:52-681(+)